LPDSAYSKGLCPGEAVEESGMQQSLGFASCFFTMWLASLQLHRVPSESHHNSATLQLYNSATLIHNMKGAELYAAEQIYGCKNFMLRHC